MFSIDTPTNLMLGLLTGLVFGFLLQRGGVTRYAVILGQFLWKDHTVLRTMLTAVVVGSLGVWALNSFAGVGMHVKGATLAANAIGGLIFGVGMVVLGYCPGTGVAALGDGSRHAVFGMLGMLTGAAVYAEIFPHIQGNLLKVWDVGKITFVDASGLSPWIIIAALVLLAVGVFAGLNRIESRSSTAS